jgi:hypothetical protein
MKTDPTSVELLTRRVEAVNKVNGYAKRLQNQIIEIITPYQGKKIVKGSGSYPEMIKKITLPDEEKGFRYWLRISEYRIVVECDTTYITSGQSDECHSVAYVKQSIHICTLTNGTEVKEITDGKYTNALREDFTFLEVWNKRNEIAELNDQIGRLESSILQFKNSDF